ncbi:MAG: hypothetical protein ACR2FN_01810 [Chitinophagaceae bacterium]
MEVHHHPDLHHKKKNFKEYFFEFLMMFLAVTLGFFAENIREHLSDKQNEKDYIISLVNNLEDDTAHLKYTLGRASMQLSGIDTLVKITKSQFSKLPVQDSIFYYSIFYLNEETEFEQNDFTVVQLRNAGGYRLIKKDHVADSIAAYESANNDIKNQAKYYVDAFAKRYQDFIEIFDFKYGYQVFSNRQKIPTNLPVAVTTNKQKINSYYNQCYMISITLEGYRNMLNEHLNYLIRLINFLKTEYDLK